MPVLLLLFVALPVVELFTFIRVGEAIGFWATLALVLGAAVVGAQIMRRVGYAMLERVQDSLAQRESPLPDMVHGLTLMVAGALLFVPGFVTDAIAVLLLIPSIGSAAGRALWRVLLGSGRVTAWAGRHDDDTVIEGEFRNVPDDPKRTIVFGSNRPET
jgi:UPF0716 protein FxsA